MFFLYLAVEKMITFETIYNHAGWIVGYLENKGITGSPF